MFRKFRYAALFLAAAAFLSGCGEKEVPNEGPGGKEKIPSHEYVLSKTVEVKGRQGVCVSGENYIVSGSTSLTLYDSEWNIIAENTSPFDGFEKEANHLADIDACEGEIYAGAEYFMDGEGKNIQIAIYDAKTLEFKRSFPFDEKSGQLECSGIACDPVNRVVWMCSWVGDESGRYLYKYDMDSGEYLGKVMLSDPPKWLQGIACHNGSVYMTSDDGDADKGEPDHMYRAETGLNDEEAGVTEERAFSDVIFQGEIEGLSFDEEKKQLILLYNRGARIHLGMPSGFYPGYDREISEVYVFDIK